jgi:uncharacterized repeat protein (TIGR02543 family)
MNPIRSFLVIFILSLTAIPTIAATYRTNVDQSGPPPGCFESPKHRYTITNPANSGQIWDVVVRTHRWVNGTGWSSGYYTDPAPTGEVVRLQPGDSAMFWHARGYQTVGGRQIVGINWSESHVINVTGISAPTIRWTSTPGTVAHGQQYVISARGHDDDGNLTQVNIWKDGQPFAFAGGGNGTDGDSSNPTSDSGPRTVIFTAQAVDANGARSPLISHTVTVRAPVNRPPTVTLLSPGAQTVTVGTSLSISARATDADGNLTSHNLDIQRPTGDWNFQGGFATGEPFMGGPVGSGADSTRTASFTFSEVGTYHIRSGANDGSGWRHSATVAVTVEPANQAPSITWVSRPGTVASGESYTVTARGRDDDGNLTQVNVWKEGQPFAFGNGGNGTQNDSSNTSSETGPRTVTFTAQAVDATGARSATISQTVTVSAPPPEQHALTTSAESGGTVSAGGTYDAGTTVMVHAIPDAQHDFAGWTGDATGSNPTVSVLIDRPKTVRARFTRKHFTLSTSATVGGTVTPGGNYPFGSVVSLTARAGPDYRFLRWSGDASGTSLSTAVAITESKSVVAEFLMKTAQTITFPGPPDTSTDTAETVLTATASSGLPVTFVVLSGPALVANDRLTVTGRGAITVRAEQNGNAEFLAAPAVTRTFNAIGPAVVKYTAPTRTLLQTGQPSGQAPITLEQP